ncbi:MAG: tetratricopeptide repeat protein [Candidatus Omnitrophota bacterium]
MKSKSFVIALTVVIVLGCLAGYIAYKIHRANVISQGETLFRRGDYNGVVALLGPDVEGTSGGAPERLLTAQAYYRLREYDKAQTILEPLLQFGRETPGALALSGWIFIKKESPTQAQERFERLKSLNDKDYEAEAEAGLGGVSLLRGQSDDINLAKSYLTRNVTFSKPLPQTYMLLAELRSLLREYDAAIEAAQKAVDLAPRWSEPYVSLGKCYLAAGRNSEAEDAFSRALENGASKDETKFYLAKSLYYQGSLRQALSVLQELIDSEGEKTREALDDAAHISLALGEIDKALDYQQRAWALKKRPDAALQLYETLARLNKTEEAERFLEETVNSWPFLSGVHLERANRLLAKGDLRKAYSAYNNVLDYDSQNYLSYYNLGCISFLDKEEYQTIDFFAVAAKNAEEYFPAQLNNAVSMLFFEKETDAARALQNLKNRYPANYYVLQASALERFFFGDAKTALDLLDDFLKTNPKQASPWIVQGEMYLRLFQFQKARKCFEEALKIDPNSMRGQLGAAYAAYRLGDSQAAAALFGQVMQNRTGLDSAELDEAKNGTALIDLDRGEIASALNAWDELKNSPSAGRKFAAVNSTLVDAADPAELEIEALIKASSEKEPLPESSYNLAVYYDLLGRLDDASAAYERLISQYPSFLYGVFNLADHYRKRGRFADASALFERARQAAPDRVDVLNNEAAVLMKQQKYEESETLLKEAAEKEPGNTLIRFNMALARLMGGDAAGAAKHLEELRNSNAPAGLIRTIEGLIQAGKGKEEEALTEFASAQERDSHDPYAALNHGTALLKLGRYAEAEESLREAVSRDPSLAATHRALGLLYCKLGLYEEALERLQVSLKLDPSQADLNAIIKQIRGWMEG